jgi:hypothetical protein
MYSGSIEALNEELLSFVYLYIRSVIKFYTFTVTFHQRIFRAPSDMSNECVTEKYLVISEYLKRTSVHAKYRKNLLNR